MPCGALSTFYTEVFNMSKKPVSSKRAQRQQQERAALNNIFNTFLAGLAAECYLFIVYRGYIAGSIDSLLAWDSILHVLMWVGLVALAGGVVLALTKKDNAKLRGIGTIVACAGLFFAASGWIMTRFFSTGVTALCAAVPILTILMLIFFLYPRDCFVSTLALTVTMFTIWICDKGLTGSLQLYVRIGAIAVMVALAVIAIVTRRLQFKDGMLGERQIIPADFDYRAFYIVSAAAVVLVALAAFVPSLTFYLIWASVIALFGELAYFTTKMM